MHMPSLIRPDPEFFDTTCFFFAVFCLYEKVSIVIASFIYFLWRRSTPHLEFSVFARTQTIHAVMVAFHSSVAHCETLTARVLLLKSNDKK